MKTAEDMVLAAVARKFLPKIDFINDKPIELSYMTQRLELPLSAYASVLYDKIDLKLDIHTRVFNVGTHQAVASSIAYSNRNGPKSLNEAASVADALLENIRHDIVKFLMGVALNDPQPTDERG